MLSVINDRVAISFANTGESDIAVKRQLLPSGIEPELAFEFDGVIAGLESAPHRGQPAVNERPNRTMIVPPDKMAGVLFYKDEIRQLFSLQQGRCYVARVLYRNNLRGDDAFEGELASNHAQICF